MWYFTYIIKISLASFLIQESTESVFSLGVKSLLKKIRPGVYNTHNVYVDLCA